MARPARTPSPSSWLFLSFLSTTALLLHSTVAATCTYIVHMDKSAMPAAFSDHRAWYAATLSAAVAAADDSAQGHMLYVYDNAMNGFSARLSDSQLEQLERSHGLLSVHRALPVDLHTTHTPEFLGLSVDSGIWPESHYGEGAIIGVVDSGVWPESESFKDDGMPAVPLRWRGACEAGENFTASMCNRKLIGARYFNKGFVAEYPQYTVDVNSTRDTSGHGTHTSSTAAGSPVAGASFFGYGVGTARGIAPRAHLSIYKVLWNNFRIASTADVLAGIDQAIWDGVDVISISFGYGEKLLYENPIAIAAFAAMEKGIFVSTSAGNGGPFFKSMNGEIPWTLVVGASTIDRRFAGRVVLGDGTTVDAMSLYAGEPTSTKPLTIAIDVDCENDTQLAENKKNIVLCQGSDTDYLTDLEISVRDAKMPGVIFMSYGYHFEQFAKFTYPAVLVDNDDAKPILDYINKTSRPTASFQFRRTDVGIKPAPAVAEYSSRGPSLSFPDVLKPDLVAPGSLVLASSSLSSTAPVVVVPNGDDKFGPFDIQYGTSMACPHAAGVAAMLRVLHPDWSPAAIRSAMMTTARTVDNSGSPISNPVSKTAASPLEMGSGQLNPNGTLDPGLVYDAGADDYVRLLCAMNYTNKQIKAIVRPKAKVDCSDASLDLNYPSIIAYFDPDDSAAANGTVREFQRTVTNVADGSWTYTARVTEMDGFRVSVKPHRLVFGEKGEKRSFTVRLVGHRRLSDFDVVHGSLSWVDAQKKHVVRSPIVATTHNLPEED